MLRRNARKIVKYLLVGVFLIACGVVLLKSIVTVQNIDSGYIKLPREGGLPKSPDKHKENLLKVVPKDERIDWHDYAAIANDEKRKGPGEHGVAFRLPPGNDVKKEDLYKVNGFNALASDFIALNRSVNDIRHKDCKKKKYLSKLPHASVIVPFHNEHLSTLLRTAISVLNRSPPELIKEVILVDDFSNKVELRGDLDEYVKEHLPKVRIIRAVKREGLIRTRLIGARAATGDVLIFLDSHSEANVNWLPPLLEPIALNRKTVVCPFIDVIDYETFEYRAQDEGARGSFDWQMYYKRLPLLPEDKKNPAEPFKSPVMAGGLFAIDRSFFWELGGYDEGLDIWGGEQYELSFKVWQCWGEMVDAPCSRIGHIYRKFAPFPNPGIGDFVGRNYKRVAEVWMDEYKEFLYSRRPHYRSIDPGDISKQKALRQKLNCRPFKWFMEKVAFDQPLKYPPVEPPDYAWGEIRNEETNLCLDTKFRNQNERFGVDKCISDSPSQSGEQQFTLTWHKDIRPKKRDICFDVSSSEDRAPVVLWSCHGLLGNQQWKYNAELFQLKHVISGRCLDCDKDRLDIFMSACIPSMKTQRWHFEHVNSTGLHKL